MHTQLEQHVLNKLRVSWKVIIPPVTVFQHRALGFPEPIISVEDRGKEGIKNLCCMYIPICEESDLIKQQTSIISDPPFVVKMFLKALLFVIYSAGQIEV